MTTAQKLWLGFGTLTGIMVLVVVVVFTWVRTVGNQIDAIATMAGPANQVAHALELKANDFTAGVSNYIETPQEQDRAKIARMANEFRTMLEEFRGHASSRVEADLADRIGKLFEEYAASSSSLLQQRDQGMVPASDLTGYLKLRSELDDALDSAQALQEARINPARQRVIRSVGRLQTSSLLLLASGATVAVLAAIAISRGILLTEEALRQSSQRNAAILEHALDGIMAIDSQGKVLEFNPAAEQIFGYRASEVVGQSMAPLLFQEDFRELSSMGLQPPGDSSNVLGRRLELTAQRNTGEPFPVEVAVVRVGATRDLMHTCFIRDISDRKQAESELQERVQLLAMGTEVGAALTKGDDLHDVLHGCTDSIVRNLKAAFARIWLYDPREQVLLLKASSGMYTHLDGDHARIPLGEFKIGRIAQTRRPHLTNQVIGDPEVPEQQWAQREGMVAFAGYPLVVDRHLMGVLGMFFRHPVSEATVRGMQAIAQEIAVGIRHELSQAELLQSHERLEERVEERTMELNATNQALVRSNHELEQFASVASHDLQEPLRKIQAFGERLHTKYAHQLDDQARQYIERMQSAAGRMRTLIDDLLTFSRVTTKAKPFESVDLAQIAHEVLSDLSARLHDSGGYVELGELPSIEADPIQMRQLLQNLISNGLKFRRPEEPPVVRVSAEDDSSDPAFLLLRVVDNGVGFDETYLDRIFEVFQRLHGRLEYEGTGMGLAITRKIVERHGGSITARSQPGAGSTFEVRLPKEHIELEELA